MISAVASKNIYLARYKKNYQKKYGSHIDEITRQVILNVQRVWLLLSRKTTRSISN